MLLSKRCATSGVIFALCCVIFPADCFAKSTSVVQEGVFSLFSSLVVEGGAYVSRAINTDEPLMVLLQLLGSIALLGGLYGFAMGWPAGARQASTSALKVPLLFLITLAICFPAMVVSSGLAGLTMEPIRILSLLLLILTLNAVLLGSLAPIAAFFGFGSDYHFLKLLHVGLFAACALYSMHVLRTSLALVAQVQDLNSSAAGRLFFLWFVAYAFVGSQMAWLLRPFIGSPESPFEFLRGRKGELNLYTAILLSVRALTARRITLEHVEKQRNVSSEVDT